MSGPSKIELRARRRVAVQFWRRQHELGVRVWAGLCQKLVRTGLGAPAGEASAKAAWQNAPREHRRPYDPDKPPPFGVPVYFKMDTPYWHAAGSAGRGFIWSNDVVHRGGVDKVSIAYLERRWNAKCLGWLTHINGERVW